MIGGWNLLFTSILCLLLPCHGVNNGVRFSFPINTLLTCHMPDPRNGPLASVPEPRFRVPLQPAETGSVWQPVKSQFPVPSSGSIDNELLVEFLGSDLNSFFSSITEPTDTPILAVENLGVEGSGGSLQLFVEGPTPTPPGLAELDTDEQRNTISRWIRDQNLGNCPLSAEWILLDESYYPRYFSGSKCGAPGVSCSFPAAQTCEPDIGPGRLAYITVLRWDCCWSYSMGKWLWECGWRKVQAPIIVDCYCGCQPRQRTDFK